MVFQNARVEVQGDSLVVEDAESGESLVVEVSRLYDYDMYENPDYPYDRLKDIFGPGVME